MMDFFIRTVGKENVSEEKVDLEVYATDSSRINGTTRLVVWPDDTKQIHQIILFAKRANLNLIFRGAGTNVVGAVVPQNSIVIDMSKLNKILELNKEYIVVEPGITVNEINRILKDKFFPIIPVKESVSTIGGMISMNSSCSRTMKFGTMKDWVMEAEIIDGTGRTTKTKDVIGKEGMLGAIIKAKLKITDRVSETSLSVYKFNTSEELAEKGLELKDNEHILSMEFINDIAAKIVGLEEKSYLIVEYLGDDGKIIDKAEKTKIMSKLKQIPSDLMIGNYTFEEDVKVPIENVAEFLYWAKHKKVPCIGHLALGIIHPYLKSREETKSLYEIVLNLCGELTGENGIGLLKKDHATNHLKEDVMKLKKEYDPNGILNMGKLIEKIEIKGKEEKKKPIGESRWRRHASR